MPLTTPSRAPCGLDRRGLLAGVLGVTTAATLLSEYRDDDGGGAGSSDGAKPSAAEERLRERSARDSRALLARYDATAEKHPSLAERLRPLRAETALHAEALRDARRPDPGPSGSGPASPSPPSASPSDRGSAPPSAPAAPKVPSDPKAALAALADAERRTADARTTALLDAPAELARVLASVAASGAAHAYLLKKADATT